MNYKRVLLISHNFYPEPTGIGKYNGEMIYWFLEHGYDCTVVTTFPYYPQWKVQAPYKNRWYKKELQKSKNGHNTLQVYRCPAYIPGNPSGKKRILQDVSFWASMSWVILKLGLSRQRFDLIFTVAPPFHLAYLGLWFKQICGGKLLYHIQDLQIETAQELKMLSSPLLFKRLYQIEKRILCEADFVTSISEGMIRKITVKAGRPVSFFPNWVDVNKFFPIPERQLLKQRWGYQTADIVCLYSGAIGEKQGLEVILQAAARLFSRPEIQFLICGSGPYKEHLLHQAKHLKLSNVKFLPTQDMAVLNDMLNMADIHIITQKPDAGDLVMPSKLTTILAVGGVSLTTCLPNTSLYNVITQHNLGYCVTSHDSEAFSQAIQTMLDDDEDLEIKRSNARAYAKKYLDIDTILQGIQELVFPYPGND